VSGSDFEVNGETSPTIVLQRYRTYILPNTDAPLQLAPDGEERETYKLTVDAEKGEYGYAAHFSSRTYCGDMIVQYEVYEANVAAGAKDCMVVWKPNNDTPDLIKYKGGSGSINGGTILVLPRGGHTPVATPAPASGIFPQELLTCPSTPVSETACMTSDDYDAVVQDVINLFESVGEECTITNCPKATFAGCVLRMAGHDLMDFDPTTNKGGSDGCVNFEDPDNKGLEDCLHQEDISLQDAYSKWCHQISLADFFVIAAEGLMSHTADVAADFKSEFHFGRTTAETCSDNPALPNPEDSCAAVQTNFIDALGLDVAGAVALMGVHTLGRAEIKNSGYDGWWCAPQGQKRFNNDYYKSMLLKGWVPRRAVAGNPNKNQWARADIGADGLSDLGASEMMLNTDLCLVFDDTPGGRHPVNAASDMCCTWVVEGALTNTGGNFEGIPAMSTSETLCGGVMATSDNGHQPQCCMHGSGNGGSGFTREDFGSRDCGSVFHPGGIDGQGTGFNAVRTFAADEAAWMAKFVPTWNKVTENGATSLRALQSTCTAVQQAGSTPAMETGIIKESVDNFGSFQAEGEKDGTGVDHVSKDISFANSYEDPVLILGVATYDGGHPAVPRVVELSSSSATIKLDEPDCYDEWHTTETVGWMVFNAGVHEMQDGKKVYAGKAPCSTTGGEVTCELPVPSGTFGDDADLNVFTTIQTKHDDIDSFVQLRVIQTGTSFSVLMESERVDNQFVNRETGAVGHGFDVDIGFVVMESDSSKTAVYHSWNTGSPISFDNKQWISYSTEISTPRVFASFSFFGGDPSQLRMRYDSETDFSVRIVEPENCAWDGPHPVEEKAYYLAVGAEFAAEFKPTKSPTKNPTPNPTNFPTTSPTQFPTASPTKSPTNSPTQFPTASPTKSPTNSPTEDALVCVDTRQRGANGWVYKGRTTSESTCRGWCNGFTYMSLECPTSAGGFECFCVNTLSLTGSHGQIATSECQGKPADKNLNNGQNGHCVDPNNLSYKYGDVWGGGWHRGMVYKL